MAECRECLHYDVCGKLVGKEKIDRVSWMCNFPEQCAEFKYSTKYAEVVRCKDCKMFCRNYAHLRKHCGLTGAIVEDDDFCSYGERKGDGNGI